MKKLTQIIGAAALFGAAAAGGTELGQLPDGRYYVKGTVRIKLKEEFARRLSPAGPGRRTVSRENLKAVHPAIHEVSAGNLAAERWLDGKEMPERIQLGADEVPGMARSLRVEVSGDLLGLVGELGKHPDLEWACLDFVHPVTAAAGSDPHGASQWGLQRILADEAHDIDPETESIRVAVIDTGVDLDHVDLSGRIVYDRGFGGNADGDDPGDGRAASDHGTHVAGIAAAAIENGFGVAGVARARIMAYGCSTWNAAAGEYYIGWAADAINDAVANGADVINCSFGCSRLDSATEDALDEARSEGVLVVVAAGNDDLDVDSSPSAGWNDHDWPIVVANVSSTQNSDGSWNDARRWSSNFGAAIDIAAPGTSIVSTIPTSMTGNVGSTTGVSGYGTMTGTSMASPHVAGAAALVQSMDVDFGATATRELLYRMAENIGDGDEENSFGRGLLQVSPAFLRLVREADCYAGVQIFSLAVGNYSFPIGDLSRAVASTPTGGTLVANGGTVERDLHEYSALTIEQAIIIKAFPDAPVVIGNK